MQTLDVSTMSQLRLGKVVLVLGSVCIIIGRISINEAIQHDGVEWHPPIGRGWLEDMVLPFTPVVKGIGSCLIGVEVESDLLCIVY